MPSTLSIPDSLYVKIIKNLPYISVIANDREHPQHIKEFSDFINIMTNIIGGVLESAIDAFVTIHGTRVDVIDDWIAENIDRIEDLKKSFDPLLIRKVLLSGLFHRREIHENIYFETKDRLSQFYRDHVRHSRSHELFIITDESKRSFTFTTGYKMADLLTLVYCCAASIYHFVIAYNIDINDPRPLGERNFLLRSFGIGESDADPNQFVFYTLPD